MVSYKVQPFLFDEALKLFKENEGSKKLSELYEEIPSGSCDICGACCYDNVPLSAGEFLALVAFLDEKGTIEKTIQKVANWYVNQFETVQPCIFLSQDNKCEVYPVRPLVCRLFGHQTEVEQNRRVGIVFEQNKALEAAVKEAYGIVIKQNVVEHVIRQCGFRPDRQLEKFDQDRLFDQVQQLDIPYYNGGYVDFDYINLSLVEWFVLAYLDEDELLDQTMALNGR